MPNIRTDVIPTIEEFLVNRQSGDRSSLVCIVGPTATGKSDLAVELALWLKNKKNIECEIISADSRQVYTGLNIGTGKITEDEMKGIPHHLLDIVDPLTIFTVKDFKNLGEKAIREITSRGHMPIICGGTGQYIDALVFGMDFPDVAPDSKLRTELEQKSLEEVITIFQNMEPENHKVDMTNKRRIIRAIEIVKAKGEIKPIEKKNLYNTLFIGLDTPDDILKNRIQTRIEKRLQAGMIEESQNLLTEDKLTYERMHQLGLEYAYIADLLENTNDISNIDIFKEKLFYGIWHYAKRQRTWFKKNTGIKWQNIGS